MGRRRLPIGIQTDVIREEEYYYVDKTAYARREVRWRLPHTGAIWLRLADRTPSVGWTSSQLHGQVRRLPIGIQTAFRSCPGALPLIEALSERAGRRVVVLVDEYDKPILDAVDEPEIARTNRDDLRGLYGTIKACDAVRGAHLHHRREQVAR